MAVLLQRSVFLHNHKTGGTWVREVLNRVPGAKVLGWPKAKGLRDAPAKIVHASFRQAREMLGNRRFFFFTFVRHPLSWAESFYAHRATRGWPSGSWEHKSFESWVMNMPKGWVERHFASFTGTRRHEVDFIGRYEDLAFDLRRALCAAREPFDEKIFAVPPQNVGNRKTLALLSWTDEMRQRFVELNRDVFERHGYETA